MNEDLEKMFIEIVEKMKQEKEEEIYCINYLTPEIKKITQEIEKEYKNFLTWAIGEEIFIGEKKDALKRWKQLHPNLPIPRGLQINLTFENKEEIIMLMLDAYPLYLKEINK